MIACKSSTAFGDNFTDIEANMREAAMNLPFVLIAAGRAALHHFRSPSALLDNGELLAEWGVNEPTRKRILEEPDIQIREVKESEEWEDTQMTIYDMGIARGRIDSIFEILEEYGNLSDNLRNEILAQTDMDLLKKWFKLAAKVSSIDEFAQKMHE